MPLAVTLLFAALAFTLAACGDDDADATTTTVAGVTGEAGQNGEGDQATEGDEANGEGENGTEPTYGAQGPGVAPGEDPENPSGEGEAQPAEIDYSRLVSNPEGYFDTGVIVEGRVVRQVSDVAFLMGPADEAASPGLEEILVLLPQARGEELAEGDRVRVTGDLRRVDEAFMHSAPQVFEGTGAEALDEWRGDLAIVTTDEDGVEVGD
jgi:hypothetical protein